MRTVKEITDQYCPSGVVLEEDQQSICIQYAKEAVQEVVKKYWQERSLTLRNGGKMQSIDYIAVSVMKGLK